MPTTPVKQQRNPTAVQSTRTPYSGNSEYNQLDYFIRSFMGGNLYTALPVIVKAVEAGGVAPTGRVDVLPLTCSMDAENNVIQPAQMYSLPYLRIQGGAAAVICDPVVGDIGLAVFAKQDVSNVDVGITEPVQPGTFRMFDISDGFYVGGFLNKTPSCYIQVLPDGNINITGPSQVTVSTANTLIDSNTTITGNLTVQGNIKAQQRLDVIDNATIKGISFADHVHGNVESGNSNTGTPK